MERIYLHNILPLINKTDTRSVVAWCKSNELDIHSDSSGKFVIKNEFNYIYDLPIIKRYKEKYGKNWIYMFELLKENKLYLTFDNSEKSNINQKFNAKSIIAKELIKDLSK